MLLRPNFGVIKPYFLSPINSNGVRSKVSILNSDYVSSRIKPIPSRYLDMTLLTHYFLLKICSKSRTVCNCGQIIPLTKQLDETVYRTKTNEVLLNTINKFEVV